MQRRLLGDEGARAQALRSDGITDATPQNPNGSCERVVRINPAPGQSAPQDAQQSPKSEDVTS